MLFTEITARKVPYGSFSLRSQEFLFGWLIMLLLPIISSILANSKGKGKFPSED